MPTYYQVLLIPKPGVDPRKVEKKFNLALDWFRFTPNFWIIYTTRDAEAWTGRLTEFVRPEGTLFICKLDLSDQQGWMPTEFWEWVEKDRATSPKPIDSRVSLSSGESIDEATRHFAS